MQGHFMSIVVVLILLLTTSAAGVGSNPEQQVSADLWKKVRNEQPVRVLVELKESEKRSGVAQDTEKKEAAQPRKVPPELMQKAQTEGIVRVLVTLDVHVKSVGQSNEDERLAREKTIATAQDELLAELAHTKYRVTGMYKNIPGIGLEVGPDALSVLERSARVLKVAEDRPLLKPLTVPGASKGR